MKKSYASRMTCLFLSLLLAVSCKTPVQEVSKKEDKASTSLLNVNKYMQERNRELALAFMERAGWKMLETETGLWYMILKEGSGSRPVEEDLVVYAYETRLLSGDLCYAADTIAPKKIVIGKGSVEAGIEEGLRMVGEGGHIRLIVPPYLAHGNFGDREKIPGAALLLVEIEILRIR